MTDTPNFDIRAAHTYFSKHCFNAAWGLIDKEDRSEKDTLSMKHAAHASLFHWLQRADCTDQSLSVGYWQLSRVYVLVGDTGNALKYAQECLIHSQQHGVDDFYLCYAYEAMARALSAAGEEIEQKQFSQKANELAQTLSTDDRELILGDLSTIP